MTEHRKELHKTKAMGPSEEIPPKGTYESGARWEIIPGELPKLTSVHLLRSVSREKYIHSLTQETETQSAIRDTLKAMEEELFGPGV